MIRSGFVVMAVVLPFLVRAEVADMVWLRRYGQPG